ncbi:Phosducin-like protein 2 [Phytophthora pseudosyringae]|uniref:Phosducin-like protein 2 n=1 Tax=Phytophthora pseudosyringae TaxID=221518 RepID=A0A8T1WG64_9STRA|nr:Phosducin-like protein 2 [Phytophthora pseudosyringae]
MGDRGNVFYAPTGETTEWEDILVKRGIIAPKTKVPDEEEQEQEDEQLDPREYATLDELDEMDDDYDDDAELARIRDRRIQEMMAQAARSRFDDVQPIAKDEWTKEVTDGSSEHWVIAYLWDEALEECKLMDHVLREVAKKHRDVKFVSIQAQACIENWPARNCPTLFMYHKGALQNQLLSIRKLNGLDMKLEDLEEYLAKAGVFKADS